MGEHVRGRWLPASQQLQHYRRALGGTLEGEGVTHQENGLA